MFDRNWIPLILLLGAGVAGCRGPSSDSSGGKLRVAVSIVPQVWLVGQIGGEHVEVAALVKPGASPETFQPSDAQISRMMQCAVFFRIGIPFESGRAFSAILSQGKLRVVDTREGIALREMTALEGGDKEVQTSEVSQASEVFPAKPHDHAHQGNDPHIWLAPGPLEIQARTIARTLGELDPEHRAAYERNLALTEEKLDAADREVRRILAPYRGRMFLVYHPAWGYFADAYGLKQVAIEAEGKEPSDEETTALQKTARQQGINVAFVQPQISSRGAEAIAKAIGARVETLDPLAPDLVDNLVRSARAIAGSYR